jgi:Sec-independent protein translocase protein TatA
MGRSLGKGMREFKDSISGKDPDDEQRQRELVGSTTGENEPVVTARERDSV